MPTPHTLGRLPQAARIGLERRVEAGTRFGRLTVVERADKKGRDQRWHCACDCGAVAVIRASALRSGGSRSCGCLSRETVIARNWRGGYRHTPEYKALAHARDRCRNPNDNRYRYYGARGIEYRLPKSLSAATDLLITAIGRRPEGMTLDRIDNDGHYEIGNLRWATPTEQRRNRRENGSVSDAT